MGPILGEPYPHRPFYPNDDRIVSLTLSHLPNALRTTPGFDIDLWWRSLEPSPSVERPSGRLADLAYWTANQLGGDKTPVSLARMHRRYREHWPSARAGQSLTSFSAVVSYHTINMPARFPAPNAPRDDAGWIRDPLFYRVGRGQYQTLTGSQVERFRRAVSNGDARIFAPEYEALDVIGAPW